MKLVGKWQGWRKRAALLALGVLAICGLVQGQELRPNLLPPGAQQDSSSGGEPFYQPGSKKDTGRATVGVPSATNSRYQDFASETSADNPQKPAVVYSEQVVPSFDKSEPYTTQPALQAPTTNKYSTAPAPAARESAVYGEQPYARQAMRQPAGQYTGPTTYEQGSPAQETPQFKVANSYRASSVPVMQSEADASLAQSAAQPQASKQPSSADENAYPANPIRQYNNPYRNPASSPKPYQATGQAQSPEGMSPELMPVAEQGVRATASGSRYGSPTNSNAQSTLHVAVQPQPSSSPSPSEAALAAKQGSSQAEAQSGAAPSTTINTAAEGTAELNAGQSAGSDLAEITARIAQRTKEIEAAADLDEQVKADVLNVLKSAGEWLTRATQWEKKSAEYQAETAAVPENIKKTKEQLAQQSVATVVELAAGAGLIQMEQVLSELDAALKSHRQALTEQENQLKQRAERKTTLAKQLEQVDARLAEIQKAIAAGTADGMSAQLSQAQSLELSTRELAGKAERKLLQAESARHEAVVELLPLRRDLAQKLVKEYESLVAEWQAKVADFRKTESERQAREARERVAAAHPALKALAERNAELAERRTELAEKIETVQGELEWIQSSLKEIDEQHKSITEKVKVVGLSSTVGLLLRKQRGELPHLDYHHARLKEIEEELPLIQLASLELEEEREAIGDVDAAVQTVVTDLRSSATQFAPEELRIIVKQFLETKKQYLDDLHIDNDAYQDELGELDIITRKLTTKTTEFCNYIDKHVLWIRSTDPVSTSDLNQSWNALQNIASPGSMAAVGQAMKLSLQRRPFQWLAMIFGFLFLRLTASRIRQKLESGRKVKAEEEKTKFMPILASLGLTLFNAMMLPALTWLIGWQLFSLQSEQEIVSALASGLMITSVLCIALEITRQACMPGGLAEEYLNWPSDKLQLLRKKIRWLTLLGLPAVFGVLLLERLQGGEWADSAGRLVFILGMGILGVLSHGLLRPGSGLWKKSDETARASLVQRLQYLWYAIGMIAPLGLAWLATTGYYYSARELAVRMKLSFWLLIGTVLAASLLTRLLFVVAQGVNRHKKHVRRGHAAKREAPATDSAASHVAESVGMEAESEAEMESEELENVESVREESEKDNAEAAETQGEEVEEEVAVVQTVETTLPEIAEEDFIDLVHVRGQVARLIQGVALVCFVLVSYNIWAEVLPAFQVLDKVELWSSVQDVTDTVTDPEGNITTTIVKKSVPTTLSHLIVALALFQITVLAAKNLPGLLEIAVLNRLPIDRGGRYAVSVICRYSLTVAGFMMGFQMLGLTWSSVQWLIAAMTVGLGFGLQEIFANFVSGMIILFERPVRVGDLVTIGGQTGHVTRVQIRATTITDFDRRELIIPNKSFITGELINWTLSDPITRVVIPIGVAYGSDTELTQRTLLGVSQTHAMVLKEPAPTAMFTSFGDSTLNFELRFYLGSRENYGQVLHELNSAIDKAFREADIEIAFPQQEVTIKSVAAFAPLMKQMANVQSPESTPSISKAA